MQLSTLLMSSRTCEAQGVNRKVSALLILVLLRLTNLSVAEAPLAGALGRGCNNALQNAIGRRLYARISPAQKAKVMTGWEVLNIMAHLGRPESQRAA